MWSSPRTRVIFRKGGVSIIPSNGGLHKARPSGPRVETLQFATNDRNCYVNPGRPQEVVHYRPGFSEAPYCTRLPQYGPRDNQHEARPVSDLLGRLENQALTL